MFWTEKYRPKQLKEIVNQEEAKNELLKFVKNFKKQKKKAVLLFGPSGTGKTAIVYALANDLGLEVIELNASHFRNKQQIQEIFGKTIHQKSLFAKGKIIFIDELEGITGQEDRGGLQAISDLIEKTNYPVILACQDPAEEKFRSLLKKVEKIEMKPIDEYSITKLLARIANCEKLKIPPETLKKIAEESKGDARAAIIDLQVFSITKILEIGQREKEEKICEALKKVFTSFEARNAFDSVELDIEKIFLWIDENLPFVYRGDELTKAYEILALADLYKARITRRQHWHFLSYVYDLLSEGIAFSKKKEKKVFFCKEPTRLLKIWIANQKLEKKKGIAQKLAKKTHTSIKEALKEVCLFKKACIDKNFRDAFVKELDLTEDQKNWLCE
ncbi:MAG: replication factor C large subunit [Candidatus Pacearchaeota archaeon]|nr:replication factor C large subunit [Candidatus Pacearchaeota archaeon]